MQFNAEKSEHFTYLIKTEKYNRATCFPHVTSHKHLGIYFSDVTLLWQKHIDKIYTSCAKRVGRIRRPPLRWRFSPAVLKKIAIAPVLVQPKLEFACAVWTGGSTQKLQKLCTSFSQRNGTASRAQPLRKRFDYHIFVMLYKIHSHYALPYLTSLLPPLSLRSGYTFRKLSFFPAVKRTSMMNSFLPRGVAW